MDHNKIKRENLIERYILRKLSPEEARVFEEHYFGCDECFEAVKETEKAIVAIKDAARRGVLTPAYAKEKKPVLGWFEKLSDFVVSPAFAATTAVLVLALIYPAWRGVVTVSRLENEIETLRQPQANAPSYYLEQTRASETAEAMEIPVNHREENFVLNFNILQSTIAAPQYRAEIIDNNGQVIWQAEDLKGTGDYAIFSIACRSSFFKPGLYTLRVYEVNSADGQVINQFSFPFKIAPREGK